MATYKTILTNRGLQLEAEAAASGVPIVLTDMAVGDGNGNPVTPNPAQTSLARERYRAELNTLSVDPANSSRFIAELIIPAATGGFTMREVGLYTADSELFAVANVPDTYKPVDSEGAFSDTIIRMIFVVSNAEVITLVIDPNVAVATRTWVLNNVGAGSLIPGGLTDQFLAKESNADGDFKWVDPTEGVTVIVFSREETQTLAADQVEVDLAVITAEGAAVYIEGVRLRADEFSQTGPSQITLDAARPAGTMVTVVQNEEVGTTDVLLRPLNLSDVPDKAQARTNLGIPNYVSTAAIDWNQLQNIPAFASRWPAWTEVTAKPATFPPSAHNQDWSTIDNKPETATRWPSWTEVTSKPSLFPPSAHSHSEYVLKAGDTMTGALSVTAALTSSGVAAGYNFTERDSGGVAWLWYSTAGAARLFNTVAADNVLTVTRAGALSTLGGFDFGSSRKLKDIDGPMPYGLSEVRRIDTLIGRYKSEYNSDGRVRLFFDAEQFAEVMPEVIDNEGVEFNGERVPAIKIDQALPPAYRAIAELAQLVDELRAEIEALKAAR
ncbi:MAG TPA: phage tail protein [Pyrinomonadaceae bacterium]|nr:phage tail protein [Pyrinomonadaceae bacterium]